MKLKAAAKRSPARAARVPTRTRRGVTHQKNRLLRDPDDARAYLALTEAMRTGDTVALVGAGLSARIGYGDWGGLLRKLHKLVQLQEKEKEFWRTEIRKLDDILWRAEFYRRKLKPEQYQRALAEHFSWKSGREKDAVLRSLVAMPFRHIFTTNYDLSIDRALLDVAKDRKVVRWSEDLEVRDLMRSFVDPKPLRHVVYLHGNSEGPQSIILTESDYAGRYVRSDETAKKLFALFSMRRVVFFGFSMSDPDLMAILRQVNATLSHRERRHFAVLGSPHSHNADERREERDRLREKFGVEPVFYDARRKHAFYPKLMQRLLKDSKRGPKPEWPKKEFGGLETPKAVPTRTAAPRGPFRAVRPRATTLSAKPAPRVRDWRQTPEFKSTPRFANDPNCGRFGRLARRDGLELSAAVRRDSAEPDWYSIRLLVKKRRADRDFSGKVTFYLHPSFSQSTLNVDVVAGEAELEVYAYGSFTVGVLADGNRTPLEYDLVRAPGATREFKER